MIKINIDMFDRGIEVLKINMFAGWLRYLNMILCLAGVVKVFKY